MIGVDNYTGPHPSLDARDVRRLLAMRKAGWRAQEVARALDISVRSVHRYNHARIESAIVGDWRLVFMLRPGSPPALLERLLIR